MRLGGDENLPSPLRERRPEASATRKGILDGFTRQFETIHCQPIRSARSRQLLPEDALKTSTSLMRNDVPMLRCSRP